jgi:hypothetical protein
MIIMTVVQPRAKVQREPRRQLHKQPAWISVDSGMTKLECFVLDVSPGGAKIMTDAAIGVGDRFGLVLVPAHPKHQPCEVVWRRHNTYGIKYLT